MTSVTLRKQKGQLPLHMPLEAAYAREDLVVSDANKQCVEFLDSWPDWPVGLTILVGNKGSGKSHLAQIWAGRAQAKFLTPSLTTPEALEPNTNYVVENLSQGSFSEIWLFHLLNTAKATKNFVLLTARREYTKWGIALPDLLSRLRSAHKINLEPADDILLAGILVKLFSDRQLQVDKNIIDYLLMHMNRSMAFAVRFVDEVDRISMSNKLPLTRPLVAKVLQEFKNDK